MEQPSTPNASSPPPNDTTTTNNKNKKKRQLPGPEEVLAHYEAQGLGTREASLQAIGELQSLLYKSVVSGRGGKKDTDSVRKLDTLNTRLAIIEVKLDSKPSFLQSFAIGLASGAAIPPILSGLGAMWNAVKTTTRSSPPSSSL
ncbi:hypothetical protein COCNU_11G013550 [Cocos nucifera]|uniref:Uncharacterized protein n=1 Tax=Cocos nucifera TaxID=13894 RepID=A0A8K0IQZ2_COCNU|nr:hypothetical protein COCNU_11G013550 [Cocos nucifera]